MVYTPTAGELNYTIKLATAYTGSTGAEVPDGSGITLHAADANWTPKNEDSPSTIAGGETLYIANERYQLALQARNIIIGVVGSNDPTDELDTILEFCYAHGTKIGSTKIYAFVYNETDEKYQPMSFDSSGNVIRYMQGVCHLPPVHLGQGNIYDIPTFQFWRATV